MTLSETQNQSNDPIYYGFTSTFSEILKILNKKNLLKVLPQTTTKICKLIIIFFFDYSYIFQHFLPTRLLYKQSLSQCIKIIQIFHICMFCFSTYLFTIKLTLTLAIKCVKTWMSFPPSTTEMWSGAMHYTLKSLRNKFGTKLTKTFSSHY